MYVRFVTWDFNSSGPTFTPGEGAMIAFCGEIFQFLGEGGGGGGGV